MKCLDLSGDEKSLLLSMARESIESALENRAERVEPAEGILAEPAGVFVTLKKRGSLRGCIGRMAATRPLAEDVRVMARAAAFDDPRFPPLGAEEWPAVSIEISVLSPLASCEDALSIEVGCHGLYIVRGVRSGVLLPQVPVEWGWNREEFLEQVCNKAGLPFDSWKAEDTELYTFEAIVFSEEDEGLTPPY